MRVKPESPYYRFLRERRAAHATAILGSESRAALALASVTAGLAAHKQRQRAAVCLSELDAERAAERAARTAHRERTALEVASGKDDRAVNAAKRRDSYRAALDYGMTPYELIAACGEAVMLAGVGADSETQSEALADLLAYVIRRHGAAPKRCDVGQGWLCARALGLASHAAREHERHYGQRAAAARIAAWAAEDARDSEPDGSGPDALWLIASGSESLPWNPATASGQNPAERLPDLDAAQIGKRLRLTERQTEALAITLAASKRVTVAMTGADKVAASTAIKRLRERFPNPEALRIALRCGRDSTALDRTYVAALALAAAMRVCADATARAASGSHLPGQRDSASAERTAARVKHPQPQPRQHRDVGGDWRFLPHGYGYGGACAIRSATAVGQPLEQRPAPRVLTYPAPRRAAVTGPTRIWSSPLTVERCERGAARMAGLAAMNAKPQRKDPLWQNGAYRIKR